MDKNNYETYEYLADNADDDSGQFFVIQDDGTFLSVNRPVQYVTQVQDVKEAEDGTQPMYDVTQQQFYVDVDNSSELISDQFVIPEGENNMYSNSYLLQVENDKDDEPMETENVEQYKEAEEVNENEPVEDNTNAENIEEKTNEDCTEITLTDEQYQLLEKKGWIMFNIVDKIYLLDNLGLHDITDDEKLVEKLKNEVEADGNDEEQEMPSSSEKVEIDIPKIKEEDDSSAKIADDLNNYDYIDDGIVEENENSEEMYYENEEEPKIIYKEESKEISNPGHLTSTESPHDYVRLNSVKNTLVKRENNSLSIKTKLAFKVIPSQIVLGKTINGKNLIASVKTERSYNKGTNGNTQKISEPPSNISLDEGVFNDLIEEALWGTTKYYKKDMIAAESVVEQLLKVPTFRPTLIGQRLIITKVVIEELHESGEPYSETTPTLVTGRVRKNDLKMNFMYLRNLFQMAGEDDDLNQRNGHMFDDNTFLHIHIKEVKSVRGITRISITLNKRHIQFREANAKKQKLIYACSACAAVYKTEEGLRLHQETECMADNSLIMDTESNKEFTLFTTIKVGKDKQYVCNQCDAVFTKFSLCEKHIKAHEQMDEGEEESFMPSNSTKIQVIKENGDLKPSNIKNVQQNVSIYRCKMCPSSFIHKATLSKHIVTKHIKIESK